MSSTAASPPEATVHDSKAKLLDAALYTIRAKGYVAATVDDICRHAGVTKGSFFHHFKGKDDLALAAIAYWRRMTEALFAQADYNKAADPFDRIMGYVHFRMALLGGDLPEFTCLLGTMVQEIYATHPPLRDAAHAGMSFHVDELTRDIQAAKDLYASDASWTAESVGYFIQSVLQGAFIFAKAKQGPDVVKDSLAHLERYLTTLFHK